MSFDYFKHILSELEQVVIMVGCIFCLILFIARIVRGKYSELVSRTPKGKE